MRNPTQGRGVQLDIQKELAIGGLGGVAGLWGGDPDTWPLAPRCLALGERCACVCVAVFLLWMHQNLSLALCSSLERIGAFAVR